MYVYPENNNPLTITKAAGAAWSGFGTKTELIPAGTLTVDCILKGILITDISKVGNYQIVFYKGAAGSEQCLSVCPFCFTTKKEVELSGDGGCIVQAGSRISYAIAGSMVDEAIMGVYIKYDPMY